MLLSVAVLFALAQLPEPPEPLPPAALSETAPEPATPESAPDATLESTTKTTELDPKEPEPAAAPTAVPPPSRALPVPDPAPSDVLIGVGAGGAASVGCAVGLIATGVAAMALTSSGLGGLCVCIPVVLLGASTGPLVAGATGGALAWDRSTAQRLELALWTTAGAGGAAFLVGAPLAAVTGWLLFLSQIDYASGSGPLPPGLNSGTIFLLGLLVPVLAAGAAGGAGGYAAYRVALRLQPEPDEDAAP